MDSVKDILTIALVDGVGRYQPPAVKISSEVDENLVSDIVTAVLYEDLVKEDG